MTTVRLTDIRACELCTGGARLWAKRFGVDWLDFCQNGVPAEVLLGTGDGMAELVVEAARKREALEAREGADA